jgi:hypothetical protein
MKNILGEDILKELQKKQEREFTFDDLKTPQ